MSNTFISYFNTYDYTGTLSTSTYALPFTPLTFAPILSTGSDFLSDKKIVWDYGDGTSAETLTGSHAYKEQGVYTVTNYLYDKNGNSYLNSFKQDVTVKNYLTDSLLISAPNSTAYTLTAGKLSDPFLITDTISWQSLSGNPQANIPIVSYISGGNSYDYFRDGIVYKHYGHLYPFCSTYLFLTSNGVTEYVEVSSFNTISTPIFIKLSGNEIVRTSQSDVDGFFCGLTGFRYVYFKDDVATPGANLFFGHQPNTIRPFSNTSTVGINIEVKKNTRYGKLSITSNGLDGEGVTTDSFNIGKIKFNNTKVGFVVRVKDLEDFSIKDIPQLCDIEMGLTNGTTSYNAVFVRDSSQPRIPLGGFCKGYFISNLSTIAENVYITARATIDLLQEDGFTTISIPLYGRSSTFNIYPSEGVYNIAKKGEYVDFKQTFKEIAFQPLFLDKKILFDDFLGSIFGDLSSAQTSIGKTTYEKIENFVDNNSTLDYSNINQLISLLKSANIDLTKFAAYNLNSPSEISRLVNLLSINHSRLFGAQNIFNDNYKTCGYLNHPTYGKNLGAEVSLDYELNGSKDIVVFEKFSGTYKRVSGLVNPSLGDGVLTETGFNIITNNDIPLALETPTGTTFKSIKDYSVDWGWGLILPPDGYGYNLNKYYLFYEHDPIIDGTITDSIINFDDFNTTLSYNTSSYNEWSKKDGVISNILSKSLYDGLNLFVKNYPSTNLGCYGDIVIEGGSGGGNGGGNGGGSGSGSGTLIDPYIVQVNSNPWRIYETGYGVTYLSSEENNLPTSWSPPYYGYNGYMEFQIYTNGSWEPIHQWTTINGEPTVYFNYI